MSLILLGLAALASITGVRSTMVYEVKDNVYNQISIELDLELNENNLLYYDDIYSLLGENRFIEMNFEDYYVLYDKMEEEIIEWNTLDSNPYKDYEEVLKLYNPEHIDFTYAIYNGKQFIDVEKNKRAEFSNITSYLSTNSSKGGDYTTYTSLPENVNAIDNYYYFENLNRYHGHNYDGTCCVIAAQIILGYYDTFYDDTIVDEVFDIVSEGDFEYCFDFEQSPGTGEELVDERFHDLLCDIGVEIGDDPTKNGMMTINQKKMIKKYLDNRGISYTTNSCEENPIDVMTSRTKTVIKNAIDNNRPVISNGTGHSTVAYAYDDDYVYVHTGWGRTARTSWDTFNLDSSFFIGAIDIILTGEHIHSNNYYSTLINSSMCPCEEKCIHSAKVMDLTFQTNQSQIKIVFKAFKKQYVSFQTIGDYDTQFTSIEVVEYNYYDDIEGISDSEYDYNAQMNTEVEVGEVIKFKVMASCPNTTTIRLRIFTLEL